MGSLLKFLKLRKMRKMRKIMSELKINSKTNVTSWGFSDGKLFYPYGNTVYAQALATLDEMEFKNGKLPEGLSGEPAEEWKTIT